MTEKDKHFVPEYSPFWQPGDPLPEGDGSEETEDDE